MALVDNAFYVTSVGWSAVTAWATGTVTAAGTLRRQLAAPAVGSERVFVCVVAGTTHATTEPTWTLTRGATTTDNTVTWQECTGLAGINGDLTNTPTWTITATPPGGVKNTAVTKGQLIKRDNAASYQICTTAGTAGNAAEPSFSNTAGTTTADNTVTWTSLGAVGNFTGGQAPHARIASALASTWAQAGNTVFVEDSHAATQSTAITWGGPGTFALPCYVLCHNGGAYPPLAANLSTGAGETQTGGTNFAVGATNGAIYIEGVNLTHSASGGLIVITANAGNNYLKNCVLSLSGTSSGQDLYFQGGSGLRTHFDNVTVALTHASNSINIDGSGALIWKNTPSAMTGTVPTTMFGITVASYADVTLQGVDLSSVSTTLVGSNASAYGDYRFHNCKLHASATIAATPVNRSQRTELVNCDSGTANYRTEVYHYTGTMTTEITIVLTGGASDGTTPIAWKVVTTANSKFVFPFEVPPIAIWNDSTSSLTATIQGIWGSGSVPNDDDIWVEFEYLGSASFPISSFISDAKATVLTTAAGQDAGAGTWGGSTTKFKLNATFTPAMKGLIIARVKCAKVSSTFYIDPRIVIT